MYRHGRVSRRSFLKTSAAATAGAALGPLATPALAQGADSIRVLCVEDPFFFALKEIIGDFTEETGVKVELESLSYDAMQARLVSSFVSKTSDADVVTVDQMWSGQYVDNGWIQTLDEMAKGDEEFNIGDFIPEVLYSLNTWRGHLATVPIAAYGQGVMYRKSVFDALGIGAPSGNWTWEEYNDILGRIHGQNVGGTDMKGTVICGSQPTPIVHMFSQVAASHGARWFQQFPQGEWDFTPAVNSPEMLAAVQEYKTLYGLSPEEAINYLWFDAGTRFSQGDIGMFYWWTPYFYLIRNNGYMTGEKSVVADDFGVTTIPTYGDKPQTISLGGWSFGIPSTTEKSDAAWQFLKWSSSAATQKKMGLVDKYGYQFSDFARRSLYNDSDLTEHYPYLGEQLGMLEAGNGKIARPPAPVYTTLEGILGLELNKVLIGSSTPEEALAQADTLFTNTLKGNFLIPYSYPSFDDTLEATKDLIASLG
ncbi:sugar ABC transporter substrate-binding protein [Frigidibacter sp. SD6-1]|uniref:ABC transporter substrate-binding protein n=1 Tax=Frigidibacter sp. SD6-1 TaxID=3032581 RepID=UPI0024DF6036|nr:sugar ABC transporter substrate-binding protein [Frigidibacter sp. SD6-1]